MPAHETVAAHQKISDTEGDFTGALGTYHYFGGSIAAIGNLDGDTVVDIAVGAYGEVNQRGATWILFLNTDGTVKNHVKIAKNQGGFTGDISEYDEFGWSLAALGDLAGDGSAALAVGAPKDGSQIYGAVWMLFLNTDGTVKSH